MTACSDEPIDEEPDTGRIVVDRDMETPDPVDAEVDTDMDTVVPPTSDMDMAIVEPPGSDMDMEVDVDAAPDMEVEMGGGLDCEDADDARVDSDYDGLSDCDELLLGCLDPYNLDTDGDGLGDGEEAALQTDPCLADSDGDGLNDREEIFFGFDPANPSTYGDGTLDGQLFITTACDVPESEPVDFYANSAGGWLLALPTAFGNHAQLVLTVASPAPELAAAVYDDPTNEVAGFVVSEPLGGAPTASDKLVGYRPRIGAVGTIYQDLTEGEFDTHDGHKAAPGEYFIRTSGKSARKVRDELLFGLAPFTQAEATGLPVSSGNQYNDYYVKVSVVERDDRYLTLVAVAPEVRWQERDAVKFRINDLTNTTNVTFANDGHSLRCYPFPASTEVPAADFYWVLDQSGSMSADYVKVKSFANNFYAKLLNSSLDFRLGVTNMDSDVKGRLRPNVGWHTSPQTFIKEIDEHVIDCPGCNGGLEYGLYAAREGIKYMRSSAASANEKIRPGAQLATIFMTDEDDQSYKDGEDPDGTGPQNNPAAVLASYIQFFAANPLAFSINGPQTNGCDFSDHGYAYEQAALASGGAFASICSNDLEATITNILDIVAGRASTFTLPDAPISSTLRVYQGDPARPDQTAVGAALAPGRVRLLPADQLDRLLRLVPPARLDAPGVLGRQRLRGQRRGVPRLGVRAPDLGPGRRPLRALPAQEQEHRRHERQLILS